MTAVRRSRGLALVIDDDRALAALWRNHRAAPSPATRAALFDHYRPTARRIAAEMRRRIPRIGLEPDDFDQLALEALLQSLDRYDPTLEDRFAAFLRIRIKGHIRNAAAKASESSAQYTYRRRQERDRLKSLRDGAENQEKSVIELLAAMAAKIAIGLILEDQATPNVEDLPTADPSAYDTLAWRQLCNELDRRLAALPDREAFVINQHYRHDVPFQQIALLLGLSKGRVSQLHSQGLERLRKQMARVR
jgi:RNA polymerase sigma factor FliA